MPFDPTENVQLYWVERIYLRRRDSVKSFPRVKVLGAGQLRDTDCSRAEFGAAYIARKQIDSSGPEGMFQKRSERYVI